MKLTYETCYGLYMGTDGSHMPGVHNQSSFSLPSHPGQLLEAQHMCCTSREHITQCCLGH